MRIYWFDTPFNNRSVLLQYISLFQINKKYVCCCFRQNSVFIKNSANRYHPLLPWRSLYC